MQGGNEKMVAALRRELVKRGKNVDVVNIPFQWYPPQRLIDECMIWRLLDISESDGERIDMVIATKFPSTVVKHPDKRIWLVHQYRPVYDLYGTEFGDAFREELAFSDENKKIKELITNIDNVTLSEARRIFTISNNVSLRLKKFNNIDSPPLYPPPDNRERFHTESYGDYILSVCRLDAKKRIPLLIEAFKYVKTAAKCIVVGSGKERESLERQVISMGVGNKIKFMGFLSDADVLSLYANAFAVFYAPYDEDYGFSTVEALLSSKPILTTQDAGGVLEFVNHGENGIVCSTETQDIADKIDWLYTHKQECSKMGSLGFEFVRGLTWDRVIERLVD